MPFNPQKIRVTRCVKEWVIDVINNPAFSNRDISFNSHNPELTAHIDPDLFRRAVTNLIIYALVHNPSHTKITIALGTDTEGDILLSIRDNGQV